MDFTSCFTSGNFLRIYATFYKAVPCVSCELGRPALVKGAWSLSLLGGWYPLSLPVCSVCSYKAIWLGIPYPSGGCRLHNCLISGCKEPRYTPETSDCRSLLLDARKRNSWVSGKAGTEGIWISGGWNQKAVWIPTGCQSGSLPSPSINPAALKSLVSLGV